MRHVSEWAQSNNLRLNTTKSVELIIHRPGVKLDKLSVPPPPSLGLTRKTTTKMLGVIITDTLSFSAHINDVIARCSQTSFALRILRAHGLNGPALWSLECHEINPWYPNCCMPLQCGLVIWIKRAETDARASLIDSNDGGSWERILKIS